MKLIYPRILIPVLIISVFFGCESGPVQNQTSQSSDSIDLNSRNQNEQERLLDMALKMSGKKLTDEERESALRMMNLNENDLISGLSFFAELSGGLYPSKLDTETTIKEINKIGSQNLQNMPEPESKQKVQDIFFASAYYQKLQRENKDVVYYGDEITAKDDDKILIRWKTDKNQYRVIYGDLSTTNIATEQLAELEQ